MDPLTITASTIALATFAAQLVNSVKSTIKAVPSMRKELEAACAELERLRQLLDAVSASVTRNKEHLSAATLSSHLPTAIQGCRTTMSDYYSALEECKRASQSKLGFAFHLATWSSTKKDFLLLNNKLESGKTSILLAMQLSSFEAFVTLRDKSLVQQTDIHSPAPRCIPSSGSSNGQMGVDVHKQSGLALSGGTGAEHTVAGSSLEADSRALISRYGSMALSERPDGVRWAEAVPPPRIQTFSSSAALIRSWQSS